MIKKYIDSSVDPTEKKCPECGDPEGLKYEEGCIKCKNCSYSVCK
jgi:ribonucleoside-diphosphate reductase alpha chain